jgi:transcriptional regulator with GAF, ATPase, and Fis domain
VHINCSALPATLVEGELFGHEKGAFTDAREARAGLFEMAEGGTVFLDEISEMPLELQAKLLLVVEQGAFRRVGGVKERSVRTRVIAASNQNLNERVQNGTFRRDLLYRLNGFTINIPPLRDRADDSFRIATAALERLTRRHARPGMSFSPASRLAILGHDWPGNVRELVNAVQRAVMLAESNIIQPQDLGLAPAKAVAMPAQSNGTAHPTQPRPPAPPSTTPNGVVFDFEKGVHTADEVEKALLMQALDYTKGNVSRAAKLIGMQRSSLRYRIERYNLDHYVVEAARK